LSTDWQEFNVSKKAFNKISDGLTDALKIARSDTSKIKLFDDELVDLAVYYWNTSKGHATQLLESANPATIASLKRVLEWSRKSNS
jgi:hypothetical protein